MLKVTTDSGGTIYFTKNNTTGDIAFSCDGSIKKRKLCIEASNKLFLPTFGKIYGD